MKVWQIATGEPGRDYHELFFDYDVMIIGPSRDGDARTHNYYDGIPNSIGNQVHNFLTVPAPGDRVLMRYRQQVIGIGEIPQKEEYQYSFNEAFSCVYGWDLAHCRRVIWARDFKLGKLADAFRGATRKPTFTQIHDPHTVEMVEVIKASHFQRPIRKLPRLDTSLYTEEEFGVKLFHAGISNKNIEDIFKAIRQAERLTSWYRSWDSGNRPSEHEVVSHILLPLFLGLGWSHQQISVEWKNVDMAFFKNTPTTEDECVMVLEAKGLGQPLSQVFGQPKQYVRALRLKRVRYIVVTDGENLFVYSRKKGNWSDAPVGYLNVGSLQKENILPKGTNLISTLVMLQPSQV